MHTYILSPWPPRTDEHHCSSTYIYIHTHIYTYTHVHAYYLLGLHRLMKTVAPAPALEHAASEFIHDQNLVALLDVLQKT
jgi:hypothetical protein